MDPNAPVGKQAKNKENQQVVVNAVNKVEAGKGDRDWWVSFLIAGLSGQEGFSAEVNFEKKLE